ncbi:septation protein SpoVG family protein [candidate division NPL-UPA2 bacterium]|nr:septation protein SpoVG family protein [candidate division NPL-UPA2 bacterium]
MEITEVRVRLMNERDRKLKAYATMTFDHEFVVHDVKVIEGRKGLFVAMPSRRLRESCPECKFGNEIRSKFCSHCGRQLEPAPRPADQAEGTKSEHRDLAHPITSQAREYIQSKVLEAYEAEKNKAPSLGC